MASTSTSNGWLGKSVTCEAPINMAVIKYWGKRDEELILPINSSLSATLSTKKMRSKTTVKAEEGPEEILMWLNGKQENVQTNKRLLNCLKEIRARAQVQTPHRLVIVSENNFPTAAGLASSASGFCCLVYSLAQLYGVQGDISSIARLGSGSACRSMYGGFVKWEMGEKDDGTDSIAVQVATEDHWSELEVLVLVVNDRQKDVSSTAGMQTSVQTSPLIKERAEKIVPERMKQMEKAILEKDFNTFAELTMRDSDSFHEVCHTTTPAIRYLNDVSRAIIALVNDFNAASKPSLRAAYTFDAGPNAVIFLQRPHLIEFLSKVLQRFPPPASDDSSVLQSYLPFVADDPQLLQDILAQQSSSGSGESTPGALRYILRTQVGAGPRVLDPSEALSQPSS